MKLIVSYIAICTLFLSISSCAKCLTCKNKDSKYKYCYKDKAQQEYLTSAREDFESNGYRCTTTDEAL